MRHIPDITRIAPGLAPDLAARLQTVLSAADALLTTVRAERLDHNTATVTGTTLGDLDIAMAELREACPRPSAAPTRFAADRNA